MASYYTFEDLSGSTPDGIKTDNPYHDLIETCSNNAPQIQNRYATHRINRNAQQKTKLLDRSFPGVTVDEILHKLEHPEQFPGYQDPRNCLVLWARPTLAVKRLISQVQTRLRPAVPNLWLMPQDSLHMTALEVTHSLTAPEIDALVGQMLPHAEGITDFTTDHRAKLIRPIVSFDAQALALSWLPASSPSDTYTYHHLRRDLFGLVSGTGVKVASRYVIPSAHLTIGRFIEKKDFEREDGSVDHEQVARLVEVIEEINRDLEGQEPVEWVIGEEKGLELRKGALWYGGGGETVQCGKGF